LHKLELGRISLARQSTTHRLHTIRLPKDHKECISVNTQGRNRTTKGKHAHHTYCTHKKKQPTHCRRVANPQHHITTILLANLRGGLGQAQGVTATIHTHKAPSHKPLLCGTVVAQANREVEEHARDKLLAREVLLLCSVD
jgi:hypothetical protein